jgi:hypothetical protein
MRGTFRDQGGLFSYISPEARVPANHSLRKIRELVREVLKDLSRILGKLYASEGRPSVPPEQLLSALLIQVFYGIRSPLLSDEHFSVDGTLIEAWASQKSFRPKEDSGEDDGTNFHGQKRTNDTHASTTDPERARGKALLLGPCHHGEPAWPGRGGHGEPSQWHAERRASEIMLKAKSKEAGRRITAGEDKAYDTADHVATLRAANVTAHVAKNTSVTKTGKHRKSAIDGRTTRHAGYAMSQSRRTMIECIFGWGKQHGTMRKTKHRGIARVAADFLLNLIAYNLIRIPKLIAA